MRHRRALTLVEIVVAVGFLAISLVMVLSLLPAGILSLNQAENLQTATTLGMMLVDEAPAPPATAPPPETLSFTLNHTRYTCRRTYELRGTELYDVVVTVDYNGARQPLEFRLRRDRNR